MRRRFPLLAALALAAGATTLAAQPAARPAPRFGILAGVNIASLSGDDTEGLDNRTGFVAGGTLTLPLTSVVSFQPELLFSQKGAEGSEEGFTAAIKLNYIEVPLLLRVDVPTTASAVRPHFYAGPALSFKASCDFAVSGGGTSASESCSDVADDEGEEDFKSFDAGLLLGGALGFDVGGQRLNLGVRYNLGITKVLSDGDLKNRVLTFYGSLEFPIGR